MFRFCLLIVLLAFCITGCTQSTGTYCADVDRYNPNTGKESSYRLTVGVKDNKVVRLDWPNGGSSDGDDFNPAHIQEKKAVFKTFDGVNFVVTLLKKGTNCFGDVPMARQCKANTKSGRRCRNMTDNPSQKCHVHKK